MMSLAGKVAVVTGASGALGAAAAEQLGRAGAAVVLNYHRNAAGAGAAAERIQRAGGKAETVQADVSTPDGAESLLARAAERLRYAPDMILCAHSKGP